MDHTRHMASHHYKEKFKKKLIGTKSETRLRKVEAAVSGGRQESKDGWKGKTNECSWKTLQARQKTQLTKGSWEVYKISKIVCGKYRGTTDEPVKDKQGQLLTSEAKIDARWGEHFSEVLNR